MIDAFYAGYDAIDPSEFDYVCKLDLDLDLPPRYFEILIDRMEADPRIGTCSGKPYFRQGDRARQREVRRRELRRHDQALPPVAASSRSAASSAR